MMELFDSEARLKDSLREIKTPFGIIYIEQWGENAEREDPHRITIYDSHKEWLDYCTIEYFYDTYDETEEGDREEQALWQYNSFVEALERGGDQASIEEFIDWLGINFFYAGTDKAEAENALSDGHPEELLPDEIETNEYVNHIGDYYIVVEF